MTNFSREYPELPASVLFEEYELKALHVRVYKNKNYPKDIPSLFTVVKLIAKLGGYLGRKRDSPPGVITLSRGLAQLYSVSIVWRVQTYG